MIRNVQIENFKSIHRLELELGRLNVFIGENGCGKSNILEAIAFAAASSQDKLENEFLATRGVRVSEPRFMRSAFDEASASKNIRMHLQGDDAFQVDCDLYADTTTTIQQWVDAGASAPGERMKHTLLRLKKLQASLRSGRSEAELETQIQELENELGVAARSSFEFVIYSPENSALRSFEVEGQLLPLGIKGEGLFAHLKALHHEDRGDWPEIREITRRLSLLDWYEDFSFTTELYPFESVIDIRDRYLAKGALFDQRSANEGFLFLLFYFTLFISPDTPRCFAIDNVDASLNPKLCEMLTRQLDELALKHRKQVILTTHNPAVLDGINLHDEEQRLFVISRNRHGHTTARRIHAPRPADDALPIKLSEAFLKGYIGGLPDNF